MNATKRRASALLPCAVLVISVSACATRTSENEPEDGQINEAVTSFEEFLSTAYQEPDTGLYIVDGDTPVETLDELVNFYVRHVQGGALTVYTVDDGSLSAADDIWADGEKSNLTYCVSQAFGSRYAEVVQAMEAAGAEWTRAADVRFQWLGDRTCREATRNKALFRVIPVSGQSYLARSFFPYFEEREVRIDSKAFDSTDQFSLSGILLHELGHTLGFVHEHTRPEAGTWEETDGTGCFTPLGSYWRAVTPYDSGSVMNYPWCHADASLDFTRDFALTGRDKEGAAALYGASLEGN